MAGCKPKSYMDDLPDLVPNTDAGVVEALNPRAVVDDKDPNLVHLIMDEKDGWVGMWQVGNKRYTQSRVDRRFEFAGDYTVKASAYNKNGVAPMVDVHFTIEQMDEEAEREVFDKLFSLDVPMVIFTRGMYPDDIIMEIGRKHGMPMYLTTQATSPFMAEILRWLNVRLAPCISIHGVLVDVYGTSDR